MPYTEPVANDNLSHAFSALDMIPPGYRGSDRFLDVVSWNIRYFNDHDYFRVDRIVKILNALNADIIVCQEILDGSLEVVAQELESLGAGYYNVIYGTTGGNQRVAIMYDLEWVRAKDDPKELFGKGQVRTNEGKDAFPRLPLHGYFTCLASEENAAPFDFQLIGLHLKSQRGGGDMQRELSAKKLCDWMKDEAPLVDSDVIMIGDWNADPTADVWEPIRNMESDGDVAFTSINDKSDFSHLMYRNKKNIGSRLDMAAISMAAIDDMINPPDTVQWKNLTELLEANPKAKAIKAFIKDVRDKVSDHMPIVTRFYFEEHS